MSASQPPEPTSDRPPTLSSLTPDHDHPDGDGHSHSPHPAIAVSEAAHTHAEDAHNHDDHDHDSTEEHGHDHAAATQQHDHGTESGHSHGPDSDDHDHDHDQPRGWLGRLLGGVVHTHSHQEEGGLSGRYMEESQRGIWALKVSLVGLGLTAVFQLVIVIISGSAGLLADTIHNFSDALTAIPLWLAFVVGRRQANRRYTYGYGRAEDLAGLFVVVMIALSSLVAFYESLTKLLNPQPITNLEWVIVAAIIGFIGNEAVAWFRIKVGQEIGSAALVADGQHARVDGLTSLAVLVGAIGVLLGFPQADPIVGLLITGAIILILKDTSLTMYRRMMDAVEPQLVDQLEKEAGQVAGVIAVHSVRGRWLGHKLFAELSIEVDGDLSTRASHDLGEAVRHRLWHNLPRLADVIIHVDPTPTADEPGHAATAHHADPTLSLRGPITSPGQKNN